MPKSRCHTHRLAGPQARMLHRTNLPCSSKLAPDAPLPVSRIALGAHAQAASSILPSTKRARERDFCARVQYCALVALATINVQAAVSDGPRSLDRISLPSDGLAPSKPSPQFTGERIGSTEKDVGATRAIAIDARRLHRAPNGINRANKAAHVLAASLLSKEK